MKHKDVDRERFPYEVDILGLAHRSTDDVDTMDVVEWCEDLFTPDGFALAIKWTRAGAGLEAVTMYFRTEDDAVMFKMRWL